MSKAPIILCLICISYMAQGQHYISSGRITYERKTNMWSEVPENVFEQFKETVPQFKSDNFTLVFTETKSIYNPAGKIQNSILNLPASGNTVFKDLTGKKIISSKNIFEKNYLIEEELKNITWKIKDDFREIAGFMCRRATTLLFDSVFVVAFYTDEIIPSTGPESFTGLPGTILGLVINGIHTTWYATKVEADPVDPVRIVPPAEGEKITAQELSELLEDASRGYENLGNKLKLAAGI